ncbi:GspH/FimT family pseudopilin [Aliamphritea ceti]|uniref:GspH/FimT family pseudopilin n=1 Tax=Aliamphritea ceti TaxID=1524258 RepID=UPI0021C434E2|nr:GspH/FimT family pseudopilin [Aliamphritea ceti]
MEYSSKKITLVNSINGFTLVELIVTLAVGAILLTIVIPSFTVLFQNSQILTQRQSLQTTIAFSRDEAVRRSTPVSVCGSSNQTVCDGSWQNGWIVFTDSDKNGVRKLGERILQVSEAVLPNTLKYINQNNKNYVSFDSLGFLQKQLAGTFIFCDSRSGKNGIGININQNGRSQVVNKLVCP